MSITKKFIAVVAFGLALLIPAAFFNASVLLFGLYNFLCLSFLIIDYAISPRKTFLIVTRHKDDTLYFKDENIITINVRNNFNKPLNIQIKDEIPDWHFKVIKENLSHIVSPNESTDFTYNIVPSKRGRFTFENIYVKYTGILGLCQKYFVVESEKNFKVYPSLRDLSKYRLIMQKNRLLQAGEKAIYKQGTGTEFESLKEYVLSDDYRKINWLVTARENKLIVNQFEEEKNQPVFILIDTGRCMSYSVKGYKKLDYAINAALILSDIVNQKGDCSGLIVFNTEVLSVVMPGKGVEHRNKLMQTLYHAENTKNVSDYKEAFKELINKQKRRSIVFVFTDFETIDEANELKEHIAIISKRHVPIVVVMKNESIIKLANAESLEVESLYEKSAALDFLARRKEIIKQLASKHIFCTESSAENFALSSINRYLEIKNKNIL